MGATSRSQVSSPLSRKSIGCHPFWAPPSNDEKRAKDKERGQQSAAEIEADEASKASKQENGFFYLPLLLGIDKAQCGFASLRLYNNFICLPWVFVSCFLLSFFFFLFSGWLANQHKRLSKTLKLNQSGDNNGDIAQRRCVSTAAANQSQTK